MVSGRAAGAGLDEVSGELLAGSPNSGVEDDMNIILCLASGSASVHDDFPHFLLGGCGWEGVAWEGAAVENTVQGHGWPKRKVMIGALYCLEDLLTQTFWLAEQCLPTDVPVQFSDPVNYVTMCGKRDIAGVIQLKIS